MNWPRWKGVRVHNPGRRVDGAGRFPGTETVLGVAPAEPFGIGTRSGLDGLLKSPYSPPAFARCAVRVCDAYPLRPNAQADGSRTALAAGLTGPTAPSWFAPGASL